MRKSLQLLDQIIEKAKLDDIEHKKNMIRNHKGSSSVGDSWMVFYLTQLKTLIEEESSGEK